MAKNYQNIPSSGSKYIISAYLLLMLLFSHEHLYSQEPDFAWVKRFGSSTIAATAGLLAIDHEGNSYIANVFYGSSFNLDGIVLQSNSLYKGYIAKYDAEGQIIWAKVTEGLITDSQINNDKIIVDNAGNIYFTGDYFSGQDSKINNFPLSTFNVDLQSDRNYFLAKLDSNGNVTWVKTSERSNTYPLLNALSEIHFDLNGNINLSGYFRESITFSTEQTLTHSPEQGAVFITKYTPTGDIVLCKKLDGFLYTPIDNSISDSEQVKSDTQGNLYRWSNSESAKTLYVYNAFGDLQASKTIDIFYVQNLASQDPKLMGFAIDQMGNVYISGNFYGFLMLEQQPYYGNGNGNESDAVLIKLSNGTWDVDWVFIPMLTANDTFDRLITDGLNNIYAVGQNSNISENKMLLQKISTEGDLIWSKTVAGLYSPSEPLGGIYPVSVRQQINGGNVWVSGFFRRNAYFDATAHFLTPNLNHYNGFLVQYGTCNTESPVINIPETTQICQGGTLELSVNFTNPNLSYRWNTGETTETITITNAGIYYVIAQENDECYGKSQEIWITQLSAPEIEVNFENGDLFAIAENVTYQWVNCDTQEPIEGQTTVNFTPTQAGSYAVEVTNENECTALSECRTVTESELSVGNYLNGTSLILYPNPAKNILIIQSDAVITSMEVTNMLGQKIMTNIDTEIDVAELPAGSYLLKATTDRGTFQKKFIKQ
ncbi:T9SS type A sorting domain-containing protein [Flavobacterium rhizosphaerae]|uniref:T9SS type A sorting domain-containing protein n=1 Tax=Flavobacterium rhizosphaerae TaxID=3163298 RepID=A0ABW8YVD1_9FLAO